MIFKVRMLIANIPFYLMAVLVMQQVLLDPNKRPHVHRFPRIVAITQAVHTRTTPLI